MKIIFKNVKVKNFLSFGNIETVFDYKQGIHAVTGHIDPGYRRNGVGKSSLLADSITFALFNKTIRRVSKEKIANTQNSSKDCVVSCEFSIRDTDYKIERGINPTYLKVWEDENEIEFDSMSHTQEWLENKICISFTAFTNMIVLNINHSKPFLEMTPQEKRPVLEDILSLGVFAKMSELAKDKHLMSKNDIKNLEITLKNSVDNLKMAKDRRNVILRESQKFEEQKKENIERIKKEGKELIQRKKEFQDKLDSENYDSVIETLSIEIRQLDEKISSLSSDIRDSQKEIRNSNEIVDKLDKSPHCPLCKTSQVDNPKIREYVDEEKSNILTHTSKINDNTSTLSTYKQNKQEKESTKSSSQKLRDSISREVLSLSEKIEAKKEAGKVESLRKLDISNIISEDDMKKYELEVSVTEDKYKDTTNKFNHFKFIRSILGEEGVSKYVVKKVLPFLNKKVNSYLGILGSDYTIVFDSELNEKLIARNRDPMPYASFSGGEKRRIDLALLLSLIDVSKLQNSIDTNILILDEVLDTSMDSDGVENFMDHLNTAFKVSYPDKAIYVITHRKEIGEEHFDSIINLVKKEGFTRIENIIER